VLRHLILKLGLQFLEFWQVSHNLTRNDINGEFIYLFIYLFFELYKSHLKGYEALSQQKVEV